jgi:hypothetical protein
LLFQKCAIIFGIYKKKTYFCTQIDHLNHKSLWKKKKKNIPYLGCIDFYTGDARLPEGFPKVKVIKRGNKTKDNDPIEVKRAMRPGFHRCKPGESINWREEYYS